MRSFEVSVRNSWAHINLVIDSLDIVAKLKLVVAYYQVVLVMPEAYSVSLPERYFKYMEHFEWASFDWVGIILPPSCIGKFSLQLQVVAFGSVVPLILLTACGVFTGLLGVQREVRSQCASSEWRAGCATAFLGVASGVRDTLPFALPALFAIVPLVSSRIFATFSCEPFEYVEAEYVEGSPAVMRAFLYRDPSIECNDGNEYKSLVSLAIGLIFLWPVGVPCLFLSLLIGSRRRAESRLSKAVAFLHSEYRPELFYWELVELGRKLFLTGFVFLIPQKDSIIRLVIAILISVGHVLLLRATAPYRQVSTTFVATATSLTLLSVLFVALLIRMNNEVEDLLDLLSHTSDISGAQFADNLNQDSVGTLSDVILAGNFMIVCLFFGLLIQRLRHENKQFSTLREQSGEPPRLALDDGKRWHVFLSHNWANQDAVATIKRNLQLLLPGVRMFLDVDDLDSVDDLELYVGSSQSCLILLGSVKYFTSVNCLRELATAAKEGLPLVTVHETDLNKSGSTLDVLLRACPEEHKQFVFASQPIPWHRVTHFQQCSLAAIAERVLLASPVYRFSVAVPLCIKGGIAWAKPKFASEVALYTSPANPEAREVAIELRELFSEIEIVATPPTYETPAGIRWRMASAMPMFRRARSDVSGLGASARSSARVRGCSSNKQSFNASSKVSSMQSLDGRPSMAVGTMGEGARNANEGGSSSAEEIHWLLFLTSESFLGDRGLMLAVEIAAALQAGYPPLILYAPDAGDFGDIITSTPRPLREAGLYGRLALEWRSGVHRDASTRLVARALGAIMLHGWIEEAFTGATAAFTASCVRISNRRCRDMRMLWHSAFSFVSTCDAPKPLMKEQSLAQLTVKNNGIAASCGNGCCGQEQDHMISGGDAYVEVQMSTMNVTNL
eukprot:CAMPEP_0115875040 /NCGR_PEP_ID=MMETSP0287-20121206/24876_1 /TAXON_ID=412157 /ORGANISM="Chrysochromulina rotalis, Strain UIO044" /LENGTH=901 /DNA_ID=CAMNT_0003330259 /DNA_START=255 /DNA_END=2960 /DNA_ORIENTATION=-